MGFNSAFKGLKVWMFLNQLFRCSHDLETGRVSGEGHVSAERESDAGPHDCSVRVRQWRPHHRNPPQSWIKLAT